MNDVFTYTVKDGDGDLSHTTLTISIGNSPPTITNLTPAAGGGDVTVNEDDLLASRGVGESVGSDTSKESLTQTGTFTVASPDGIKSLTIDGHTVISNGVFTATTFATSILGNTLAVTGYDAATGVVSYSYTLLDNETHTAGAATNSLFENLAVVLTDQDNQTANDTLVANIVDDVPTAVADIDSVAAGAFGAGDRQRAHRRHRCDRHQHDRRCCGRAGRRRGGGCGRCGGQHQCRPRQCGDVGRGDPGQPSAS